MQNLISADARIFFFTFLSIRSTNILLPIEIRFFLEVSRYVQGRFHRGTTPMHSRSLLSRETLL